MKKVVADMTAHTSKRMWVGTIHTKDRKTLKTSYNEIYIAMSLV